MIKKISLTGVLIAIVIACTACAATDNGRSDIDDVDIVGDVNLDWEADTNSNEMHEFITSYKYPSIQDIAFRFFKAYIRADIESAKELMVNPNSPCLEYFSTDASSLDTVTGYSVALVKHEVEEIDGREVERVKLDIRYFLGDGQVRYMCLSMEYVDAIDDNGCEYKTWRVTSFDFEA